MRIDISKKIVFHACVYCIFYCGSSYLNILYTEGLLEAEVYMYLQQEADPGILEKGDSKPLYLVRRTTNAGSPSF
jgi:hypothetical protein